MKQPIISFRNFSFKYFSQADPTLKNINLDIFQGEVILIVGGSGSGKSTLGHCINGLIPFSYKGETQGSLHIKGIDTSTQNIFQLSKTVGTVLQDSDSQFVGLVVAEDIAFALENDNVAKPEMVKRVKQVADMVSMSDFLDSSPLELSGGQKQRTALAGVMVDNVEILLFDEPLANLDPATGKAAIEIINSIHNNSDKTVIIIEHRLEDVLHRNVDRIIVMDNGEIVADMKPDDILCSDELAKNGIREPLYITAMKYAKIPLLAKMKPSHVESIDLNTCVDKLLNWHKSVTLHERKVSNESILRLENVDFSYDAKRKNLKNINFDIKKGEIVSIIGKNGAGKSTITKLICGFEKPDSGNFYTGDKNFNNATIKERAKYIGLVMQNPNQMISQTKIFDEVAFGLRLANVDEKEIEQRVKDVLEICGLAPFLTWPISALSYGQKKRVTIASILVMQPHILILDEPTAGQDYRHYKEIMEFIKTLNNKGMTIIFITHDMHLMLEYSPRAIVLADGEIIADKSSAQVLTDEDIIKRANLKETSLFSLAKRIKIDNPTAFVNSFIDFEEKL